MYALVLLLPPYLYEGLNKAKLMPTAKYPRLATELGTCVIFYLGRCDSSNGLGLVWASLCVQSS